MNDMSSGDPPSIGIAVLLFNYTGWGGPAWGNAAQNQLNYLMRSVPRTYEGGISHRADDVQMWLVECSSPLA